MSETNHKQMLIVVQDHRGYPTFSLIRLEETCPFVECIYLPEEKKLAIITTVQKDTFHNLPKLDTNGDIVRAMKRPNDTPYKEERKALKTFYEYTLVNEKDIINFVHRVAVNSTEFDFEQVVKAPAPKTEELVS
tara:strand:+ start:1047 stop:1448 length:402 start_codon:yes stop_codon:yes gene_type:complete